MMQVHGPDDCFRQGMKLLSEGSARDAVPFFSAARMAATERNGMEGIRARSLSYYGLCLGFTQRRAKEALSCCRKAVELEEFRPELWLNLARVAELARRRGEAYRALSRGLARYPGHRGIVRELRRMGFRRSPVIAALPRSHAVNIVLGRLLNSLRRRGPQKQAAGA